jgi:hypothetical protein
MDEEIWKPIPGFPSYEVSNHGRVQSFKKKRPTILKPGLDNGRYLGVLLSTAGGKPRFMRVHQLVMLTFIGPYPKGMEVCHNDNNGKNNHLSNLRYDTHKENARDHLTNGYKGKPIPESVKAKIRKRKIAKDIRVIYAAGNITVDTLGKMYNMVGSTVYRIITGQIYKKAGGPIKGVNY